MLSFVYKVYAFLFARNFFAKFNKFLYQLSLRGLGVLNFQGQYLSGEKGWLRSYLINKESPIVLDVGSNIGNYALDVLDSNKSSRVYAFEPHPKTYKQLVSNLGNNIHFEALNFGVGDKAGSLELYDYDSADGSQHASLYRDVIKDLHKGNPISHVVKIIKLDDFISERGLQSIDLLKIDTEGNEFSVLLGCLESLKNKKIKAIQIEFNEMNVISKNNFKDFWDLLKDYEFYRLLPGGQLLPIKNYSPIFCEIYAFQNIVAIQK